MSNILLTGGHAATTGVAVIEEIKKRHPKDKIFWIGAKSVFSKSQATSLEYKFLPSLGVNFYPITAGKLQTKFTRYTIPLLLLIPVGFFQALVLLIKIKPKVVLSFGGYSSFPVVFWSWIMGMPVILHEQTVAAGRANIASAFFCKKIAVARIESEKYFPKQKTVVIGNPLSKGILEVGVKKDVGSKKTVLIVGGSRGSEFINEEVSKIDKYLKENYKVIHITGESQFERFKYLDSENYKVIPYLSPSDMPKYYELADVIIARSGANTVSEVMYIKRPTIFVLLPRTYLNEQYKNAKYAESFGIASVLTETDVENGKLIPTLEKTFADWKSIVGKMTSIDSPDKLASAKVVDLLEEYL